MSWLHFNFGLEAYIGWAVYIGAVIAFIVAFFRPAVALYVLVPLLPFQTVRYRLHPYPLGHAFIDLLLLASLTGSLLRGRLAFPKPFFRFPFLAIIVTTYFSLWKGAAYLGLSWPLWFNNYRLDNWKNNVFVPVVLFVAVFCAIRTKRQMAILLVFMCLTVALFNRNVYNGIGQGTQTSFSYEKRAGSGRIGSNGMAAFEVEFGFFLMALVAFERRWWLKVLCLALATFCFYCVMLTYSRGGYLAFLMAWLMLGLVKQRKLLIGLIIFLFTWQALVPNSVRERIFMTYQADGQLESSAASRVTVWDDALEVIGIDPVFGVGYDTYEFMHRVGPYTDTHNFYMKVLVETGGVGLAVFLLILCRIAKLGWTMFRRAVDPFYAATGLGLFLWVVCASVTNLFGDRWTYIEIVGYMWTIAAFLVRGYVDSVDTEKPGSGEETELALHEPALPANV